ALSPVLLVHGKVVDVDLAAGLLELRQHVSRKAADDSHSIQGCNCDERVARKQATKVVVVRLSAQVGFPVVEGRAKKRQQRAKFDYVCGIECAGSSDRIHVREMPAMTTSALRPRKSTCAVHATRNTTLSIRVVLSGRTCPRRPQVLPHKVYRRHGMPKKRKPR